MKRAVKVLGLVILPVIILLGALAALNRGTISRALVLQNGLDADRIVETFSNMDTAFLSRPLSVPIRDDLRGTSAPLPETVTVDGRDINVADLLQELDTTALVILRDGKIIHESYYRGTGPDDLRISWSVAKSFMSGLYGNALESGAIRSLDDLAVDYVPELQGTAYETATLRNILNMSSGVAFNEDYRDRQSDIQRMARTIALGGSLDDYTAGLAAQAFEPGSRWQYVSMDTHVAAWALRNATGESLHTLFEQTYGPLGFRRQPYYLTDGEGVAFALGGLNMTTRDYAKFGQLFLQEGNWKGEQRIPADWVRQSTRHSAPGLTSRGVGYGYQWWVPMPEQGDVFAVGIYGQYVYVDPKTNIVIAKNAADREFTQDTEFGVHSMSANIALFRGLSAALGNAPQDD